MVGEIRIETWAVPVGVVSTIWYGILRHDAGRLSKNGAVTMRTMRFPVENCSNKVIAVSESLDTREFLELLLLLLLYSRIYLSYHIK